MPSSKLEGAFWLAGAFIIGLMLAYAISMDTFDFEPRAQPIAYMHYGSDRQ
jgi:hypothetical protein